LTFSLSLSFPHNETHKKKRLEDAEEAESEIVLADEDDPCELVLGECFVEMEHSEAEETLNEMISREKDAIGKHKEELNTIESAMKDLKAKLYGKFGTSINLEE
jgi:prefoldin subunit 4